MRQPSLALCLQMWGAPIPQDSTLQLQQGAMPLASIPPTTCKHPNQHSPAPPSQALTDGDATIRNETGAVRHSLDEAQSVGRLQSLKAQAMPTLRKVDTL